ncbi:hypothetical protein BV22DRAFT_1058536 [Leucogyrophana mollusca]|uniref:Uncharacterized protein n=1 Tax=Leucogyrophana mollusca TaxID=85980 RepID=A0ACB8BT41_9AGAM|nr:hypothetical protein BV22DRAFT_1058536 [Leucogyrophana mollusca]
MGLLEPGQSTKDALDVSTHCTSWDTLNPNFFVSEGCYRYLEAWVGIDGLPLRNAHVPHTRGLSFAGELYEIVNSRMEQRDRSHGLLPCIDYGDLADSCEQYQDVFPPRRKGFVHIARGIAQGLRGRGLLTDVMLDFNCWMFMRPDRWPYPPKVDEQERLRASTFGDFTPTTDSRGPLFARLSSEELLMICCQCTVSSYLALAATSKSFHMRLTAPEFLDLTMKEMIARGSLRWIMPVESMPGEVERAVDAAKAWLSFDSEPDVGDTSVFSASAFPAFKFVYACFQSDSMRNRQRIWGQAKQYELLWKDFRSKGWEVNRF